MILFYRIIALFGVFYAFRVYIPHSTILHYTYTQLCMGLGYYCVSHIANATYPTIKLKQDKSDIPQTLTLIKSNAVITQTAMHSIFSQHLQHTVNTTFSLAYWEPSVISTLRPIKYTSFNQPSISFKVCNFKVKYSKVKKSNVNLYSALSCCTSKGLRYGSCVTRESHSFTCHPHTNHTCLYSPTTRHHHPLDGTHSAYPRRVGQAELTWVACYIPR